MTKAELDKRVADNMSTTKDALQLLYDSINKGQQKQLVKRTEIKELLDRYGVEYEEAIK